MNYRWWHYIHSPVQSLCIKYWAVCSKNPALYTYSVIAVHLPMASFTNTWHSDLEWHETTPDHLVRGINTLDTHTFTLYSKMDYHQGMKTLELQKLAVCRQPLLLTFNNTWHHGPHWSYYRLSHLMCGIYTICPQWIVQSGSHGHHQLEKPHVFTFAELFMPPRMVTFTNTSSPCLY